MGTPRIRGLCETFDAPGASPTTTQYVFFETDPGEVPPRATIASSAPSRVYPSTDPVDDHAGAARQASVRASRRSRGSTIESPVGSRSDAPAVAVLGPSRRGTQHDRGRDDRTDGRRRLASAVEDGRRLERLVTVKGAGQLARGDWADVSDAERHEQTTERHRLGTLNGVDERGGREFATQSFEAPRGRLTRSENRVRPRRRPVPR